MQQSKKSEKYIYIDALKGISILFILLIHSSASGMNNIIGKIAGYGGVFTQAFFVISAFLTWKSLSNRGQNEKYSSCKWILHRFLRLAPMYYLALFISIVFIGGSDYWLGSAAHVTPLNVIMHFAFLHGFFPAFCNCFIGEWFLGVLFIFYIFAPLLFRIINTLRKSVIAFIIAEVLMFWMCKKIPTLIPTTADSYLYELYFDGYGFVSHIPTLLLGVVLFYVNRRIKDPFVHRVIVSYALMLSGLMVLRSYKYVAYLMISVQSIWGLFFFIYLISQRIYENKILNNKFFMLIGENSYGIYLFHGLLLHFFREVSGGFFANEIVYWLVEYSCTLILAMIISVVLNKIISLSGQTMKSLISQK